MSVYSDSPAKVEDKKYHRALYNLLFLLQTYVHRSINNSIAIYLFSIYKWNSICQALL